MSERPLQAVEIDGVLYVDYADAVGGKTPAERAHAMIADVLKTVERLTLPWHQRLILRIRRMFRR